MATRFAVVAKRTFRKDNNMAQEKLEKKVTSLEQLIESMYVELKSTQKSVRAGQDKLAASDSRIESNEKSINEINGYYFSKTFIEPFLEGYLARREKEHIQGKSTQECPLCGANKEKSEKDSNISNDEAITKQFVQIEERIESLESDAEKMKSTMEIMYRDMHNFPSDCDSGK